MKTGVVFEIKGKHAIVMTDKGDFIKVYAENSWEKGSIVNIISNNLIYKQISAAACFILVMFLAGYSFLKPSSYIEININPDIEFTLNRYSKIIKVNGLNKDGRMILENLNLWGKNIDNGIEILYDRMNSEGILTDDKNLNIIVISDSKNNADNLEKNILDTTHSHLNNIGSHCNVSISKSSMKLHEQHSSHNHKNQEKHHHE